MHITSAVDFAIAMNKPILLLEINGFNPSCISEMYAKASYLHKKVLNVADAFDLQKIEEYSRVDRAVYQDHVLNYMSQTAHDLSPAQVMVAALKQFDADR